MRNCRRVLNTQPWRASIGGSSSPSVEVKKNWAEGLIITSTAGQPIHPRMLLAPPNPLLYHPSESLAPSEVEWESLSIVLWRGSVSAWNLRETNQDNSHGGSC